MTSIIIDAPPPYKTKSVPYEKESFFDNDEEGLLPDGIVGKSTSVAMAQISIRMRFMRKVFGILAVQLLFTSIIGAAFIYTPGLKGVVQQWSWMVLVGFILSIGLLMAMYVKRHEVPTNYILLAFWTVCQSYTVGVVASFFDKDIVVEAFLLTGCVVAGLFLYALQTKRDFSSCGAGLFTILLVLILGGFIQLFLMSPTLDFVLAITGAIIFSLFIIYDVQMVMQHLSAEEYILGTINLYLDILNLFLQMLRILQYIRRD